MAKKKSKTTANRAAKRKAAPSKARKFNLGIIAFAVVAVLIIAMAIYFDSEMPIDIHTPDFNQGNQTNPDSLTTISVPVQSGSCEKDSQCFITRCIDREYSCVNTTELTNYSKLCNDYLEWVIEVQNASVCGCVDNECKMLK